MKINSDIYLELKKYSLENASIESCGLIYEKDEKMFFEKCINTHSEPENFFKISTQDYLRVSNLGTIKAVFHSHPKTEGPSARDIQVSKNLDIPFLIYSIKKNKFYDIQ